MLSLEPEVAHDSPFQILCLGAHADDIEIGCGGTVLELLANHPDARVHWAVLSARGIRESEASAAAERFTAAAQAKTITLGQFRDGYFPFSGSEIKDFFEDLKGRVDPDIVLTHHRHDLHQDHRMVSDLTWNTFRNHLILEYEIPKYDGDLGVPNFFTPISSRSCDEKIAAILECFSSQRDRYWFTDETFRALLRLRGVESRSPTGYAEGFHARKIVSHFQGPPRHEMKPAKETK